MYKLKIDYENKNTREKELALSDILKVVGVASKHKTYASAINKVVGDTVKDIRSSRKGTYAVISLSRKMPYALVKEEKVSPVTFSRETKTVEYGKGKSSLSSSRENVTQDLVTKRVCKDDVIKHQIRVKIGDDVDNKKSGKKKPISAVIAKDEIEFLHSSNGTLVAAINKLKEAIIKDIQQKRREAVTGTLNPNIFNKPTSKAQSIKGPLLFDNPVRKPRPTLKQLLVETDMSALPGFKVLRDKKNLPCYFEEGTFLRALDFKSLSDMLNGKSRSPILADRYLGIEIELLSRISRKDLGAKIHAEKLAKYVSFADDGSLRGDETYCNTVELRVLVKESEMADVVTRLCKILEKHCKVNSSCGLHVHLDMREQTGRDVKTCYSNLVTMQHFMLRMLNPSRSTGSYSHPNSTKVWGESNSGGGNSRYYCVNPQAYSKHKTIEIRAHSGTVNGTKIVNWCKMLMAISNAPIIARSPTTLGGFQLATGADSTLLSYIHDRLWKFKKLHEKANVALDAIKIDEPTTTLTVNHEESEG